MSQTSRFVRLAAVSMIAAAILVGAGCAKKATTTSSQAPAIPGSSGQATEPAATTQVSGNPCDNPYYPLKNGYEMHYQSVSQGYTVNYVMVQSEVTASSAKLSFTFDYPKTFTVTQNLNCKDGSITTDGFLDVAGAMGGIAETETKSVSGDLMPDNLVVGQSWTTGYDTVIKYKTMKIPGLKGDITSRMDSVNTVTKALPTLDLGNGLSFGNVMEVTVKTTTTTTMNIDIPGAPSGPQISESTSVQYWAKGVGLVKSVDGDGATTTVVTKVVNP